jgi:DnaJ-class molecular chaperone
MNQTKKIYCLVCSGKGYVNLINKKLCWHCFGSSSSEICDYCKGVGKLVISERMTCITCKGLGYVCY